MIKVLAIEDSPVEAELLRALLDLLNVHVTFDDGGQAWNIISSSPPVDLVIIDLVLKDIPGWRLIQHIRSRSQWAEVPILVVSGVRDKARVQRALDAGASAFIAKPYDVRKFRATLERYLGPLEANEAADADAPAAETPAAAPAAD